MTHIGKLLLNIFIAVFIFIANILDGIFNDGNNVEILFLLFWVNAAWYIIFLRNKEE
jgi:hypothetical protein